MFRVVLMALAAAAAYGRVEAPARSIVAWVFMNSVDYANGCNIGDNSDEVLSRNYRYQIEDAVAVGARVFLLDTFAGSELPGAGAR